MHTGPRLHGGFFYRPKKRILLRMALRTRIAPTPSGFLHLGNALSFLHTAARARALGAKLLLRIDDMDRERVRPAYVDDIFETLEFLQIQPDEGPGDSLDFEAAWSQRLRLPLYNEALEQLARQDAVFACTCSRADLQREATQGYAGTCIRKGIPLETPGAAWRLHTASSSPVEIRDHSGKLLQATLPDSQQFFIVRKRDGFPSYQLSSLADDVHFGVDYIVRGADLWESTIAQLYLARVLGKGSFLETTFEHHPLVCDEKGEKLSKSAGATSISHLRRQGMTLDEFLKKWGNAFYP